MLINAISKKYVNVSWIDDPPILNLLETFLSGFKSEQTKRAYKTDISSFIRIQDNFKTISDLKSIPDEILTDVIYKFIKSLEVKNKGYVINGRALNRKIYSISSFFNFLIKNRFILRNPCKNIKAYTILNKSNTPSLSKEQVLKILSYLEINKYNNEIAFRNYLIFLILFCLALRRTELIKLKWEDIKENEILVLQKADKYKYLPITPRIKGLLNEFQNLYKSKNKYIFHPFVNNRTGDLNKHLSSDLIFKIVKDVSKNIIPGINISPHSFRKALIEISLDNNQDIPSIIQITGHSTYDSIRYYDGKSRTANKIVNFISNLIP